MLRKSAFILTLLAVCFIVPAFAQKAKKSKSAIQTPKAMIGIPPGITRGVSVEGISQYHLANGLEVLLFPDNSKQTMTVNMTYKVGSRHEGYGETGMAHLLEHLVFKGTPKHKNIPNELTAHGASPNGTTWYDRTNYFETFNAVDSNLVWALDLESDRMINSFIAKKDLETEMTVVRNEFERGENNPSSILMQRVLSTAYLWHNYGKSTIGARSDLENVPIERLQAFYKKYYQPDNAVLTITGKIDTLRTLWLVDQYFSGIPKPTRTLYATYTSEPVQDGERSVVLRRTGDVKIANVLYHVPPGSHPEIAAVRVISELLTTEPSGRLYKALVESKKATAAWHFTSTLKEPGFALYSTEVRKDSDIEEAKRTLLATIDGLITEIIQQEEFDRAKKKLLKDIDIMMRNSERVGLVLSEFIGMGDWRLFFVTRDFIKNVSLDDVRRAALTYYKPSNRTVGVFIPEDKPDRTEVPVVSHISDLVNNYKGGKAIDQGEDFDPSPKNIDMRTHKGSMPGLKWAFLPKLTRGNTVSATLTMRFGDLQSTMNQSVNADFVSDLLDKGTTTKTRQQIKDQLDSLKARVFFGGGSSSATVSIETIKENLPAVMDIVMDMLKNPAFPEKDFEELRQELLSEAEQSRSEPQALMTTAMRRHFNQYEKGDPRYVMTANEEIEAYKNVKLEDVKAFYNNFYGINNATMAVVGDFDEAAIKEKVTTGLADWKSKSKYARIENPYKVIPSVDQNIETPDKANASFMAAMDLEIRDDDPDYPAMMMANYILGGGFLNSRLATRIRQKEGLSYGVGSQFFANSEDRKGYFSAYAIYAPENRIKLEKAFKEEIERACKEGFTQKELDDARTGFLQSRTVSRTKDPMLCGSLNQLLYLGRTMEFTEDLEQKIAKLTPEQISAAFKKHVDYNKLSFFKAGDFQNKLQKP